MNMASETTPLTSGEESRTYLFLSQRHRNRRSRIRQFQCCVCAAMLGIFVTAMVITVSYSMNHDPEDDLTNNETNTNIQVLLPAPANKAALKTLLSLKWPRPDILPPDWPTPIPTDAQITVALEAGEMSLKNKDDLETRVTMAKYDPASPGILKLGTPSYLHQEAIKTSSAATKAARMGYVIEKATKELVKGKSAKHSVGIGPQVNPHWIPIGMVCKAKTFPGGMNSSAICPPSRYRTMDGTCNNLVHPDWGVAMRPLRRAIPPDYGDGISSPRMTKDGSKLPSARDVSLSVHRPVYRNDPHFTVMLAVWGQFFDHDITATALSKSNDGTPISCCTADGKIATDNVHPECYPVVLSPEDPYYSDYGMTCMNFVRSAPAPTCNFGPREQLNQITSFIDGSVVYGSSEEQAKHLRSVNGKGELQMLVTPDGRELLPPSKDPRDGCNKADMIADGKYCFKSGDTRANENLHLTTMHLLLAREHNRIVRALAKMNPTWDDERLYQEGRHIVSAQMQHITYNEFLPVVLGQSMMDRLKLAPMKSGYSTVYDPEINPAVANNFATAAFRFAHTLLPTLMRFLGNDTSSEEYVELHKILFNPYALYYPGKMDGALQGALNTDVQRVDTYITPEVTQHLFQQKWSEDYDSAMKKAGKNFKGKKKGYGLDLASLNVQRGRDHGLPSYPEWREYCGLSRPQSFSDLNEEMDEAALERLANLYQSVDDVDMYSGSLSEIPVGEGLLGPTFSCLIADQFLRLKTGDRYWYETSELPQAFTPEQLAEIRSTTLASLICENSGVDRVQWWVMRAVDNTNPRMMCKYVPHIRLEAWQDKSMVGHVKLSPSPIHVKAMPKESEDLTLMTAGSSFIKGTVASASITAMGSDGTAIVPMQPSTTFPMTLPIHLFDQKIPVTAGAASDFASGIIPPFYHGGGGVTWTGSLTSSDPTKAHLKGSFSVPVFKHGATAFDFSMTTYTGDFDIYLNLSPSFNPLGVPTLQGTYNSGIYFKIEPSAKINSLPSIKEVENLMSESGKGGPKLPMAPVLLYGTYSVDHTEFYWDGNVSVIIPPPMLPIVTSSGGMAKPKTPSTRLDVSAVWGIIRAKSGPPLNPGSANSKTEVTTWWDGTLPVAIPQPAFDRTIVATSYVPASSKTANSGGVTWSGFLTIVDGSDDVQLNGTFSFPVFLHGTSPSAFTLHIWHGDFSIILRSSPTPGVIPLATSLGYLGSGKTCKSPIYFRAGPQEFAVPDDADDDISNVTIPIILHGFTSIDKSIFYWNGKASVIVPQAPPNILMAQGRGSRKHGRGESKFDRNGFDQIHYQLQAAGGSPVEPLILTINSATVSMTSIINTNATGKNITWNGEFPVTLPQSPFYRKGPLALPQSNIDIDYPYSPLAAPASSAKKSYKSELTWSNLLVKVINSTTNDLQINGSLSFPVYYFPSVAVGPWPGPTIENWSGNFSVVVNANSTTGSAVPLNNILNLINLGNFTSSVYFTEDSEAKESAQLASAMSTADKTTPLKVIMLLHGVKSLDKTEFYWNGVMTLIIRGLPKVATEFSSYNSVLNQRRLQASSGSFVEPLVLAITSATVSMTSTLNTNATGKNITWNGDFPVILPQSPFYRKGPLTSSFSSGSPLTTPASTTKKSYKSELTWSNLLVKVINSTTNDLVINGSLSFPVYYFPSVAVGPWPGPTIENWSGNFSVVVNANSTTGSAVPLNNILNLINLGNFTSSVYFTEDSEAKESVQLASAMSTADKTTPLKVIMLLHGVKSLDKTEFYWNGVMTLIIRGLPTVVPTSFVQSSYNGGNPNIAVKGSYISGRVTTGSIMGQSKNGRVYWWNGMLPLTIGMPAFDTVSPNAGVYNWPFVPTIYNGTGGVTWGGTMSRITSRKNGISVKGFFSVPVFIHGNPSAFSVDEWNGSFEMEMNLFADSPLIDSFPSGMYNSPIIFRERNTLVQGGILDSDLDEVTKIENIMMLVNSLSSSNKENEPHPRVPIIIWGKYSADRSMFYWEGNVTVIFPTIPSPILASMNKVSADIDSEVTPPSNNIKLPFKILTGSLSVTSPIFGKKVLWDGKIPFTTLRSYFNGYSANTSYIGGSMKWTGRITRSTDVVNGAHIEGTYSLPIYVHKNGGVAAETMTGSLSLSISFTGTENIVDWAPNEGTYSSIITIAPGKPSVQLSLQDDGNPLMNMAINNLMKSMNDEISNEDPNVVMVLPACFFGEYDPLHFTFSGDGITIVPANVSALVSPKHKNSEWDISGKSQFGGPNSIPIMPNAVMPSESDSEVTPPSNNIKLPFKILTGSLSVTSPIFGKKVLWDGKIPFTTLRSYFNGYSANTSYIGGSMKWTGHITRSTDVVNGAHIEGTYSLPIYVHKNGGVAAETMTGSLSLSISFTGTENIVDWAPNEGTYSSIITIAPGKPSVQLSLQDDGNPLMKMAINNLMKSMNDEISNEDPNVVMVLPACFFGEYDPLHFTFSGDGITIVPANVSALVSPKHKNSPWDFSPTNSLPSYPTHSYESGTKFSYPFSRPVRQITPENDGQASSQRKNIKLTFKVLSGSLTSMSPTGGQKVLWDGKIPFTVPRSYFDSYSENTSFIGGPMKWTGHSSRTTAVENGAQIEGSFSIPIFVHSNDTVSVEFMTGDLSLQISFSGTQNIVDLIPNNGKFSSLINIAPAHPDVSISLREAQVEAKHNMLLNMALKDLMNSIENENSETDSDALIKMPACFFGYYDAENFTFNGDAIAIIPVDLTNPDSLEYENIVQDMTPTMKLQIGAASPYISGTVTSGSVMALSKGGRSFWWNGALPLPISMPPFDSISPNAGVYNWPYNPTSYNGTGGVTWSGTMSTTNSEKGGLSVKGYFTVPVFNHGSPSAFSVDEWNGSFELEMSIFYNNTVIGSPFPTGTFNSPMIFREYKTLGPRDPSDYDLESIKEIENMLMFSTNLGASGGVHSAMPQVPVILWGNYSVDKTVFNWEGNITVVFPPIPNKLFTELNQITPKEDSEGMSDNERIRLPMKILTGKITSTSPVFGEKILWDGTIPFITLQSYFSKYSTNSSFIGGPVQWTGQISHNTGVGNGAQIMGSFAVPIYYPSNGTELLEYLTGDFSFVVNFNGTQNIVDLIPNSGKYTSYIILGASHDEIESYMVGSDDDEPSIENEKNKQLKMTLKQLAVSKISESGISMTTVIPLIFLGDYGSNTFTFNGEAIAIIPIPEKPKLLSSSTRRNLPNNQVHDMPYSRRNLPGSQLNDLPYHPVPFPSHFNSKPKTERKIKIFGTVKSGQIYGGGLGHRTRPMWQGSFPALIPMPAFDRRSHHNESHAGHPHHPHQMDGGITWEATEIGSSRDGGYIEGNFFFPVYKHGRYHTYSIRMWTGQFSFHFTLPGDQRMQGMVKYWKRYTSKMYFHHFHSDWDLFNPGSKAEELRDKANKLDNRINRRSSNNGPIIILKGKKDKSTFSWSGKFILIFTV